MFDFIVCPERKMYCFMIFIFKGFHNFDFQKLFNAVCCLPSKALISTAYTVNCGEKLHVSPCHVNISFTVKVSFDVSEIYYTCIEIHVTFIHVKKAKNRIRILEALLKETSFSSQNFEGYIITIKNVLVL